MIQVFRTTGLPQKCCRTLPFQQLLLPRECSLAGEGQQGAKVPGKLKKKAPSGRTPSFCLPVTVLFCFYLIPNNSLETLTANVMAVVLFDCLPLIVLRLQVHDSSSHEESLLIWSTTNSKQIYG